MLTARQLDAQRFADNHLVAVTMATINKSGLPRLAGYEFDSWPLDIDGEPYARCFRVKVKIGQNIPIVVGTMWCVSFVLIDFAEMEAKEKCAELMHAADAGCGPISTHGSVISAAG
jgi:hypothetical protein